MSETDRPGTRSQEHEIEIDAPVEAVWRALTDADEVIRWYVQSAEIDAREGGIYKVSWGEGMDGTSDIVAFDRGRRLRLEHRPMPGAPAIPTGPIAEEYLIETRGGKTVLRLIQSGIPDTEDWDWFYDGTRRGWRIFFLTLRHYLEHHPGRPRDHIVSMVPLPAGCDEAWTTLTGAAGLGMPQIPSAGESYRAQTGAGLGLAGKVVMIDPPYRLLITVDGLNNALLGATLEQIGDNNFLYLSLSTYGLDTGAVEEVRERWEPWLSALFPTSENPVSAC